MIDLDKGLEVAEHTHTLELRLIDAPTLPPNWSGGKAWIPTTATVTVKWKPGVVPTKVHRVEMSGWCVKKDGTASKSTNSGWWFPNSFRLGWPDNTPEYVQRVADNALTLVLGGWTP